jgi:hypothetical protein
VRRGAGLGLDFNFLGSVIEQADADVIEAEVLLDLSDNLAQHVHGIVAGNRHARDVVEKCQLPRTPLFLGEQARILDRNRYLAGGGHQDVEIALFEHEFPFPVLIATITPAGLLPSRIGAAHRHLAGCSGR